MKTGLIWLETFRGDVQLSFNSKSQKINYVSEQVLIDEMHLIAQNSLCFL